MLAFRIRQIGSFLIVFGSLIGSVQADAWKRHVIDDSAAGADGVRLLDIDQDGKLDMATGGEEAGLVRAYLHPQFSRVKQRWPQVTVGNVPKPEDAVFCDLDQDGRFDLISCCEGSNKSVFVHWSPKDVGQLLTSSSWTTEAIPALVGQQAWMFCVPGQIDGIGGPDLIVGSKGENASISLLINPARSRELNSWQAIRLRDSGWIMSLQLHDMNQDGAIDILLSDRRGTRRGVYWLENPGVEKIRNPESWREHLIGGQDHEVMFLDRFDFDADGRPEILTATQQGQLLLFSDRDGKWSAETIELPKGFRRGKGVAAGDIDKDGSIDFAATTEDGSVAWYRNTEQGWQIVPISTRDGIKFDRAELIDLDGDGDLDLITCEERTGLGVIWYENPLLSQ